MNITVVTGHLVRPPERRTLPSGEELVSFDLSVVSPDGRAETVPVVWSPVPASAGDLEVGEALLVVGRVRRRFFRSGGATQSRTEVVADGVVPVRKNAAARRLVAGASSALAEAAEARPPAKPVRRSRRAAQEAEAS